MKYRLATQEDTEKILAFSTKNNHRPPTEWGVGFIAENEAGEVVGFFNIAPKTFVDPLVVEESLGKMEKIRILDSFFLMLKTVLMTRGISNVYYTTGDEDFEKFLEKRFGVERFTNEPTFIGRI